MASEPCLRFDGDAVAFVLGDVPAERRAEMVAHIDGCAPCRREVAALAGALDSISAAVAPIDPRAGFVERVLAAADAERRDDLMSMTLPDEASVAVGPPARPIAVVVRRRRTLVALTLSTLLLTAMGASLHAWGCFALAGASALVTVTYLALVISITHTKARDDLAAAFQPSDITDDAFWRELGPELIFDSSPDDLPVRPVVAVDNAALARFVLAYFAGWALTPVVALIKLRRGDLAGIEQSSRLARIVALQRRGRAQSLKLLVAGATTVAVAGGGTAASMILTSGVASAATPTYTVNAGDTLSGIAARYGTSPSYLAQLNGISNPNFILPGEVIKLGGSQVAGSSGATGATYTVRAGDTLDTIAARFGTTAAALAAINHISNPNLILAGETLRLTPAAGSGPSSPVASGTYQVRPGDTLAGIAARFGTTVASLAAINHISDPDFIEVGQTLNVSSAPAQTSEPSRPAPTTAHVSSGYVNPFRYGSWSPSRIDEGVDWIPNATSPVVAIGDGVITYSSMGSGWPAGGFIAYRLTSGSHAGLYVYVAEHITNLLPVGTVVSAGERIATALPGYPWTEWGWASPSGPEPAASSRYSGAADGTATPGGRAFARFLISLGVAGVPNPGTGPTTP